MLIVGSLMPVVADVQSHTIAVNDVHTPNSVCVRGGNGGSQVERSEIRGQS